MDEIARKVLISTKSFIEKLTTSNVLAPDQLTEAHMAVTALGYELARAQYDPEVLEKIHVKELELASKLRDLLKMRTSDAEEKMVSRKWHGSWRAGVGAKLTAVIASATSECSGATFDASAETDVAQRLRDFLVSYHKHLDPMVSGGTGATYQGGRGDQRESDSEPIYITAPRLQDYLRDRFPEHRLTTVTDVNRLMGGYSKETYIVKLNSETTGNSTIVIRKDGFGLPTGSSVVSEYDVLQEARAAGVPAPEALWLESDYRHFGAAFMAVGFVAGKPAHLNVPTDLATQRKWSASIARMLAKLHSSTGKPGVDVRDTIRADIADLQRRVEERERSPHPGLAFGLSWLTDHLGELDGRPTCRIHGDIGFHNMLMRDDELIALFDWEFSHFSDPVEDLIYIKPFIDQLNAWQPFLDVYTAESGFTFDDTAARYFSVWKEVRNGVACEGSLNSLLLPQVKDVALSVAGNIYIPKYEIAVLDAILNGGKQ